MLHPSSFTLDCLFLLSMMMLMMIFLFVFIPLVLLFLHKWLSFTDLLPKFLENITIQVFVKVPL